jgi:hypothetical protein
MRAFLVVLPPPRLDLLPSIDQSCKPVRIQTFVSQPAIKALHVTVLHRAARLNVHQSDPSLFTPRQKVPAGELWPVVATYRFRLSSLFHHSL